MQLLLLLITQAAVVYSEWHVGEEKQQTTTSIDTEDASKPIPATSPVECILECQRKKRESFYVEDKGQCFCLESEDQKIFSPQIVKGFLYKNSDVSFYHFCIFLKKNLYSFRIQDYLSKESLPTKIAAIYLIRLFRLNITNLP